MRRRSYKTRGRTGRKRRSTRRTSSRKQRTPGSSLKVGFRL